MSTFFVTHFCFGSTTLTREQTSYLREDSSGDKTHTRKCTVYGGNHAEDHTHDHDHDRDEVSDHGHEEASDTDQVPDLDQVPDPDPGEAGVMTTTEAIAVAVSRHGTRVRTLDRSHYEPHKKCASA